MWAFFMRWFLLCASYIQHEARRNHDYLELLARFFLFLLVNKNSGFYFVYPLWHAFWKGKGKLIVIYTAQLLAGIYGFTHGGDHLFVAFYIKNFNLLFNTG